MYRKMKRAAPPAESEAPTQKRPTLRRYRRALYPKVATLTIKRNYGISAWAVGSATTNDFWRYYQPDVAAWFNNFAEFSPLFDEYKVNAIKFTFYPRYDTVDGNPATLTNPNIKFITAVDGTSKLTPTGVYGFGTMSTVLEQDSVKVHNGLKPVTVYWKPKVEIPSNIGPGVTFVDSSKTWISTNSTSVPMRGFHAYVAANNFSTPANLVYDVVATWYITFRNLK